MGQLSGVWLTAVSLAAGWVALWPLRGRLGPKGYHLAAYPLGLVVWPAAMALQTLLRTPGMLVPAVAVVTAALFGLSALVRRLGGTCAERAVPAWTYAAWGAPVLGVAALVGLTGITSWGYDSVFHFERWGTWLRVTDTIHPEIMDSYGALIPSVHAANRFFGGDWTSTPYPVLSLHVIGLLAVAVYDTARERLATRPALLVTAAPLLLMVTTPRYVHHTLYVHGHMVSAAFLLLSVYALRCAYVASGCAEGADTEGPRLAWLVVAGVASAGLSLSRADGIAYLFVPALVATLTWWEGRFPVRDHLVYLTSAAAPIALVYGAAYSRLGFWRGGKLSGRRAAGVLAVLLLAAAGTLVAGRLGRFSEWLRRGRNAMLAVLGLEAAALVAMVVRDPENLRISTLNMVTNLFSKGGNGHLWFFLAGAIAVSVLYGGQWRNGPIAGYLLFAIAQFFFVAVTVHGLGHVGRLAPNDSFNRVSFHVVPVIFWYMGTVLTAVAQDLGRGPKEEAE